MTDTTVYVGSDGDILHPAGKNCHVLEINNPILTGVDLLKISALNQKGLRATKVSLLYDFPKDVESHLADGKILEKAVENLCGQIDKVYSEGFNIVILSILTILYPDLL